ncbi:MAG TPA: YhfC family glutamic-type intramembrane protease [Anaerolineales bacterium]|nr:YhfC family glutamic-type intramembrane protease [Anaerolineales bacterium]
MLETIYVINFLGMIALPVLLGIYLARKFKLSWKLFLAGGLTFIASQVLHIPLLTGLTALFKNGTLPSPPAAWSTTFNAVLLGLLAGIFEETARFILFKFFLKQTHTWNEGLFIGLGHGGTEAIILGLAAAAGFINMIVLRNVDISKLPISAEQIMTLKQQVTAYWSVPYYVAILGLVERVFAISLHLSLSVMVLYSVLKKQSGWFWFALLWHSLVDGLTVYLLPAIGMIKIEGIVTIFGILSLGILFAFRPKFPQLTSTQDEQVTSV